MSDPIKHAICWAEIPVSNLEDGLKFYSQTLEVKLEIVEFGGGDIIFLPMDSPQQVAGHIYIGKPAPAGTGPTVHLRVTDNLEATSARSADAGATLIGEPVSIPSGRFQYIQDPDGNSIGLFEEAA